MDDDNDDWFGAGDEPAYEPPPTLAESRKASLAQQQEAASAPGESQQGAAPEEPAEPEPEAEYLDPDKLLLFKHWIRWMIVIFLYNFNNIEIVISHLHERGYVSKFF